MSMKCLDERCPFFEKEMVLDIGVDPFTVRAKQTSKPIIMPFFSINWYFCANIIKESILKK
jgi:hypothetical protein